MHWSWDDLMNLPADLYPELIEWLNDESAKHTPDVTIGMD